MRHCYASLSSGWTYIETDSTSSFLRTSGSFPSLCTSICPLYRGRTIMPVTLLLRFQAASDSGFAPASHGIARNIASSSTPSRQATAPSRILPRSRPTPKPIAADSYTTGASAPPRPVSYPPNRHPPPLTPPKTKTPSTIPPLGPNSRGVFRSYLCLSHTSRLVGMR